MNKYNELWLRLSLYYPNDVCRLTINRMPYTKEALEDLYESRNYYYILLNDPKTYYWKHEATSYLLKNLNYFTIRLIGYSESTKYSPPLYYDLDTNLLLNNMKDW